MTKSVRPHPSLEVTRTRNQTINWSGLSCDFKQAMYSYNYIRNCN